MASAKPSMPRDGTMQVTAKEGVQYLESEGKTKLLEMQGLKGPEKDEPTLKRDSTMAATAKEADVLLGDDKPDEDAKTRGQQAKIEEVKAETASPKKPKMAKGVTMVGTAKEADRILGDDKPDVDAMTRGQQKKIEEISKQPPASPAKKPRIQKDGTMAATAKEAKAHILGKEKLGDTRQQTKATTGKPSTMKKTSSISKAIEEAKWVVPDINVNEGRRTRSQSNPKPGMKRAGTMQETAKAGRDFLKRSKKGKKSKEIVEEEEEEEDEEA
ncbi:hypothetical protein FSP39_001314 [Pinctada imbricata]|uniref:Uncharacterized protein n=1 Tax=Pinctada imbricata TaxID=66713 RepID=A0AA88YMJ4_PINIB|nr:hypothetical protein FSP39_001314 [Pinctada imbricata]